MLAFEQKGATTSVHVIIQMLEINFEVLWCKYVTTSYFFNESGCEYSYMYERVLKP